MPHADVPREIVKTAMITTRKVLMLLRVILVVS
jgi:hypothetical protein